jgi:hypothetical protein
MKEKELTAVKLIQKLKDKAFQTENDKKLIESFEIERLKQLTPVEWFYEQLPGHIRVSEKGLEILQQAKEIEKKQMIKSILDNRNITSQVTYLDAEKYYNETFKQQEQ